MRKLAEKRGASACFPEDVLDDLVGQRLMVDRVWCVNEHEATNLDAPSSQLAGSLERNDPTK